MRSCARAKYLTPTEIERLMKTAGDNRYGHPIQNLALSWLEIGEEKQHVAPESYGRKLVTA